MKAADPEAMRRAIGLARQRLGLTGENPAVGCVIVRSDEVVGEAATAAGGRPHAEEQALEQAGDLARGAIAYVTLEPCGERSSGAPSCAERLVAAGIDRAVIACQDASTYAAGRGTERLQAGGVVVTVGFLNEEASFLYDEYRPTTGRPDHT